MMMLDKLRALKGKSKMDDVEQRGKMSAIDQIRKEAASQMGGKLKGLKKVEVEASSPSGLEKGLSEAKDLVGERGNLSEGDVESMDSSAGLVDNESLGGERGVLSEGDEEGMEHSPEELEMSHEELDQKIQQLLKLKMMKSEE